MNEFRRSENGAV